MDHQASHASEPLEKEDLASSSSLNLLPFCCPIAQFCSIFAPLLLFFLRTTIDLFQITIPNISTMSLQASHAIRAPRDQRSRRSSSSNPLCSTAPYFAWSLFFLRFFVDPASSCRLLL